MRMTTKLLPILATLVAAMPDARGGVLADCNCDALDATCDVPGAPGAADLAASDAAGALLVACAGAAELAGLTLEIAGHYRIHEPIVLGPGTKLVGKQRLLLDHDQRPVIHQHRQDTCGWAAFTPGQIDCEPILAPGAIPTVIEAIGLCDLDPEQAEDWWWDCAFWGQPAITVQAGGSARRFTITQGAQAYLPYESPPAVRGISVAGSDATISEVDVYGVGGGIHISPCRDVDIVDEGSRPRCGNGSTAATGVVVASSVVRYTLAYPATLVNRSSDPGILGGVTLEATFDSNVLMGGLFYGLFVRVFAASDVVLDVTTRNNWVMDNLGPGISVQARYGGERNRVTWFGEGDLVERNEGGIELAACESDWETFCRENVASAELRGLVIRDQTIWAGLYLVGATPNLEGQSRNNRARMAMKGVSLDGRISCDGLNAPGNQAVIVGTSQTIIAANDLGFHYVPAPCTESAADDRFFRFIDEWLVLGMYLNPDGAAPPEEVLLRDHLAAGDVTQSTILPAEGDVLPATDAFAGPGLQPVVARIDAQDPVAGTVNLNELYGERCFLEDGGWACAPDALVDEWDSPPGNVIAYLFTYVENLTGAPLPVDVGIATDDGFVLTLRGVDPPGIAEEVAHLSVSRWYDPPAVLLSREPATLPVGTSLLTLVVAEGGGDWGGRVVLLEPGSDRTMEALGLVRYGVTPP
jgi:hypothetical protein